VLSVEDAHRVQDLRTLSPKPKEAREHGVRTDNSKGDKHDIWKDKQPSGGDSLLSGGYGQQVRNSNSVEGVNAALSLP
jgi:hypothetical protein